MRDFREWERCRSLLALAHLRLWASEQDEATLGRSALWKEYQRLRGALESQERAATARVEATADKLAEYERWGLALMQEVACPFHVAGRDCLVTDSLVTRRATSRRPPPGPG